MLTMPTPARRVASPTALLTLMGALWLWPLAHVTAQEPPPEDQLVGQAQGTPEGRLELARKAFRDGRFAQLRPLLLDVLEPEAQLETRAERQEARSLLVVGLYFEAQSVPDAARRQALLDTARAQCLRLLREQPEVAMDPLIYPASVVELLEQVRQENAEELNALLRKQQGGGKEEGGGLQVVYVERGLYQRSYALNWAPFGLGQLQQGREGLGTFFAVSQGVALGLNVASYLAVESLRGADGTYNPGADRISGDYAAALTWRNVQYGALAAFVLLYGWSVTDALIGWERDEVLYLKTLEGPPPEIQPNNPLKAPPAPQSLFDLHWSWRF
jgi:hypothetical protein